METRIYLITHSDGCWLKAEYTADHAAATRLARADYGDDVTVEPVPDSDAAAIKLAKMKPTETLTRKVILADGQEVLLDGPRTIEQIRDRIGADCLDTVRLRDRLHVMLVDDDGHPKGLPVNEKATRLYWDVCVPGTTHQIRGAVVIVPDSDFGGDL